MKTLKEIFFQEAINHTRDWTKIDYLIMKKIWKEYLTQKRQKYDNPTAYWKNPLELIDELLEELQEE